MATLPTVVAGTEDGQALTNGTTVQNYTYDAGTGGSDRCLIVAITYERAISPGIEVTVKYNAVAMTQVASVDPDSGGFEAMRLFRLTEDDSLATGSNTLEVTHSADPLDTGFTAAVFQDVDQTNPTDATKATANAAEDPGGTDRTHSITTINADSQIITSSVMDSRSTGLITIAAPDDDELFAVRTASTGYTTVLGSQVATVAGAFDTGFNSDPTAARPWAILSLELRGVDAAVAFDFPLIEPMRIVRHDGRYQGRG